MAHRPSTGHLRLDVTFLSEPTGVSRRTFRDNSGNSGNWFSMTQRTEVPAAV
jgi:hypothetical protein